MFSIETIAVMGANEAGMACVVLSALAGCAVRLFDASAESLDRAFESVRRNVDLAFAAGVITPTERQRILDGILFTPDLDEALTAADLALHAAHSAIPHLHERVAENLRATAAVAAVGGNPAEALATRLPQPGRVLALRLADSQGPVPRLEVVAAPATSAHVLERVQAFAARVNRAARIGAFP